MHHIGYRGCEGAQSQKTSGLTLGPVPTQSFLKRGLLEVWAERRLLVFVEVSLVFPHAH